MARGSGLRLSSDNEDHRNPAAATILRTSQLSKDQPNRILIYIGSFNPPHISHLQVLRHALESSPDLNIVAAIISMMDEDHLERKNQLSGRSLVLTSKKRAKLWYEDSRFPACAWVCESWTIFDNLQKDLVREATKDDLEIRFMSLRGPDSWNVLDPPMPNSTYQEYLISDAGREAEWYVVKEPPQVATWYTPWERVNPSTIRTNGQAEQGGKSRSKLGTRYAMEMLKATPCFTESAIAESSPIESLASLTSSELSNRSSIPCNSGSEASISSASGKSGSAFLEVGPYSVSHLTDKSFLPRS
jgi:Cytidylyltransferase-like